MKTYLVGGSVRDELLGLPVQDRDYVVVGASPEEMVREGFRPVGADFPVFLSEGARCVARGSCPVGRSFFMVMQLYASAVG